VTETKRRGRPPGSRNRPKVVTPEDFSGDARPEPTDWSRQPPGRTRVFIFSQRAFGDDQEETEIDWPEGWPPPKAGDSVLLDPGRGGRVEYVEFWPNDRLVKIRLR
jgi:hypothetical protein